MESHVAVQGRYIFEFPMAQIALDRFRLGLRLVGCHHGTRGRRISWRWTAFPYVPASWRISLRLLLLRLLLLLLLLLSLLLRLLLLLLKSTHKNSIINMLHVFYHVKLENHFSESVHTLISDIDLQSRQCFNITPLLYRIEYMKIDFFLKNTGG